jgi:integrase
MAYFRKRSGSWEASIEKKGYPRISRTFDTKTQAEAWAKVTEAEMLRGAFVSRKESENTTLSDALERYKKEITERKKGAYQESRRIELLKAHKLGIRFLASIQGKDIAEYRDERAKSVSEATVRRELTILSHLFEVARKEWGMEGLLNPVQSIRLPSGRGTERDRRLKPEEKAALLKACDDYGGDLPHIVRFALETAMRRGEITGMMWNMVNLKNRTVVLPETKNGEKRDVPLSREAMRILSELPRRLDGRVFGYKDSHSITQAFIRALSRARLAYEKECSEKGEKPDPSYLVDLTFHDLRHEAASRFFEKGLNPMQVAAITGHKTLQMLKRYTHLKAEDLAELLK